MRLMKPGATAALAIAIALGGMAAPPGAKARVFVGVGVGGPLFYPGYYPGPWYYPPVYAQPVYAPPRVIYANPPAVFQAQPATAQTWYYCDSPKGYYPYIQSCNTGWRPVAASPTQGAPQ